MVNLSTLNDLLKTTKERNVLLIVVSKTRSIHEIQELYDHGIRDFGENRVQEMVEKYEALPKDIRWHMIGHLQKNKIKYLAEFVYLIHAVDSLELAKKINKEAKKHDRIIPCLLQLHIAQEVSKFGFERHDLFALLETGALRELENIKIEGLMAMSSFVEDENQIDSEFSSLKNDFDSIKEIYFKTDPKFKELSMGMSGDFEIALKNGSTMVRIGSKIFGPRTY